MIKLVVFDVDGVLLDSEVGGFKLLAEAVGRGVDMRRQHEEYKRRMHAGPWGLEQLAELFAGLPEDKLKEECEKIVEKTLRREARAVIHQLRSRRYLIVAYSSNPLWIMGALQEKLKLDDICGNELEVKGGIATGKLALKIDRYGKEKHLLKFMEKNSLKKEDIFIFGDSVTDLPMAQHGNFYSFNTTDPAVTIKAEAMLHPPLTNILEFL